MKKANLVGQKFNMLTVLREVSATRKGTTYWECKCDCGTLKVYSLDHLTRKKRPVKSCGCLRKNSGKKHRDWKGCGDISGHWWSIHVTRELSVGNNRHRVNVSLKIEEAWDLYQTQNGKCALSGIPIYIGKHGPSNTASLDRIDSSKGYELGNVQWVHKHINFMKRDFNEDYFLDLCRTIVEYQQEQTENSLLNAQRKLDWK